LRTLADTGQAWHLGSVGQAHAEVAGQLLADGEAEAVRRDAVGAPVQGKRRSEAGRRHHARDAALLCLQYSFNRALDAAAQGALKSWIYVCLTMTRRLEQLAMEGD